MNLNIVVSNGVKNVKVAAQIARRENTITVTIRGRAPEFGSSSELPWAEKAHVIAKYSHFKVSREGHKKIREQFPDLPDGFRVRVLNPD